MYRLLVSAALFIALLSSLPAAAITGGAPAPASIAAQTALIVSTRGASCSGAVLAHDLVLTAAHCVQPAGDYAVVLLGGAQPRLVPVARIVLHPGFDPAQFETRRPTPDLALLKISEPLPLSFRPVLLAQETALPRPGDSFTLAGYGMAADGDGKSAGKLRTVTLPAVGTTGGIMVRLSAGTGILSGACTGDSGGPAFRGGALAAVIGWINTPQGRNCGAITGATLVARQRDWILTTARMLGVSIRE